MKLNPEPVFWFGWYLYHLANVKAFMAMPSSCEFVTSLFYTILTPLSISLMTLGPIFVRRPGVSIYRLPWLDVAKWGVLSSLTKWGSWKLILYGLQRVVKGLDAVQSEVPPSNFSQAALQETIIPPCDLEPSSAQSLKSSSCLMATISLCAKIKINWSFVKEAGASRKTCSKNSFESWKSDL